MVAALVLGLSYNSKPILPGDAPKNTREHSEKDLVLPPLSVDCFVEALAVLDHGELDVVGAVVDVDQRLHLATLTVLPLDLVGPIIA